MSKTTDPTDYASYEARIAQVKRQRLFMKIPIYASSYWLGISHLPLLEFWLCVMVIVMIMMAVIAIEELALDRLKAEYIAALMASAKKLLRELQEKDKEQDRQAELYIKSLKKQ